MKQISYCLLLFFCSFNYLLAQSPTFAPIGSKWGFWYQSALHFGNFQKEAVGDTTISGRVCRKFNTLDRSYICTQSCVTRLVQSTAFIAQSQDSIFLYNAIQNTFTFLYHFHAQVNDTLTTQQLKYVCVRVGDTLFSGVRLKKWEFNQVCPRFLNTASFILLEKVGPLNSDWGLSNSCVIDGDYHSLCFFRDSTILFQRSDCITNIRENNLLTNIIIAPNPVSTNLTIEAEEDFNRLEIFNAQGQMVVKRTFQAGQLLDVASLTNGIYFLHLLDDEGKRAIKRFIKN